MRVRNFESYKHEKSLSRTEAETPLREGFDEQLMMEVGRARKYREEFGDPDMSTVDCKKVLDGTYSRV
jgi:hypothetical protein